ncbi:MAG: hypothetical protein QNJ45_21690 [Ardenticatenaceae bacterium]|nr:hypothetical protein [Ardenticatenaceae bacterium]
MIDQEGEFAYRSLDDLHRVVSGVQNGLHFRIEKETAADEVTYIVSDHHKKLKPLRLLNEDGRQSFLKCIEKRTGGDIDAFFEREHRYRGEDMKNWIFPDRDD